MIRRSILLVLMLQPLWSAKFAVLQSGFRIQVERWENSAGVLRLFHASGSIDLAPGDVLEFIEEADAPGVLPAPPLPAPPPVAVKVPSPQPPNPKQVIAEMAANYGLPEKFVASVARAESAFQPSALSPKGAIGVMQLMPGTAKDLGVDPTDVRQNIEGGTKLLRDLLVKYQNDPDQVRKALAAYNAGPGAVAKYGGVPPYDETRQYVNKVLREYQRK